MNPLRCSLCDTGAAPPAVLHPNEFGVVTITCACGGAWRVTVEEIVTPATVHERMYTKCLRCELWASDAMAVTVERTRWTLRVESWCGECRDEVFGAKEVAATAA